MLRLQAARAGSTVAPAYPQHERAEASKTSDVPKTRMSSSVPDSTSRETRHSLFVKDAIYLARCWCGSGDSIEVVPPGAR